MITFTENQKNDLDRMEAQRSTFSRMAEKLEYKQQAKALGLSYSNVRRHSIGLPAKGTTETEAAILDALKNLRDQLLECAQARSRINQAKKHGVSANRIKKHHKGDQMGKGVHRKDQGFDGQYQRQICLNCELPECQQTKALCPLMQEQAGRRREVYDFIARYPRSVDDITEMLGTDAQHASAICTMLMKSKLICRINGKWTVKK